MWIQITMSRTKVQEEALRAIVPDVTAEDINNLPPTWVNLDTIQVIVVLRDKIAYLMLPSGEPMITRDLEEIRKIKQYLEEKSL